jgi:LacI family transcriptional regulator
VRERNIRIPEDISVIGFDDLFFSGMLEVPLTTIRQPVDVIAVEACRVLLEQMNGTFNQESIKIEPHLIERKSVKAK